MTKQSGAFSPIRRNIALRLYYLLYNGNEKRSIPIGDAVNCKQKYKTMCKALNKDREAFR